MDWRARWYPVSLVEDLPRDRPHGFSIHGESRVLFTDREGRVSCLADRCPHRSARLSDGRLVDGGIECGYHGWQFDAGGTCLRIPQLPDGHEIPERARARSYAVVERQGIAWVWGGGEPGPDEGDIPVLEELDRPETVSIDFMMDLPYGQAALIENVIDIAHIHIAHDGVRGGGRRELARPLEFEVLENSATRIRSRFRSKGIEGVHGLPQLRGAVIEFVAPNLVKHESIYEDPRRWSGLALYSLPLERNRCRLIYRAYSNFWSWKDRWKPRALQHWTQCTILEQDMQVVIGQVAELDRSERGLEDTWLPIKSSDALALLYRKWLDAHGTPSAGHRPFSSSATGVSDPEVETTASAPSRFELHTRICKSCSSAHALLRRCAAMLAGGTVALLALGVLRGRSRLTTALVVAALLTALGAVAARRARARFE